MEQGEYTQVGDCADWIIRTAGPDVRLALPLGLGKANRLANEIYRRARRDPNLRLRIITALTLELPEARGDLEARFLGPLVERLYRGYPELDYARDRRAGRLPDNVEVYEFYLAPGGLLDNAHAQQHYISSNYTHVTRDLLDRDVNVVAQLVARRTLDDGSQRFSLSCNPDLTLDVAAGQREAGRPILIVGEVNDNLPFMYGDAEVAPAFFDAVVATPPPHFRLFGTPKTPVSTVDHAIGLHASTLVRDGGSLQIGIGSLGDAVTSALKLRHQHNSRYRALLDQFGTTRHCAALIQDIGGLDPFGEGLYGATEMLVDGFLHLYHAGILKRRVFADRTVQRLVNEKRISEDVTIDTLKALKEAGAVAPVLASRDVDYLRELGVFDPAVTLDGGDLVIPGGGRAPADLDNREALDEIEAHCLGSRLTGGVVASAGFFLGPEDYYTALKALPPDERALINMTSVLHVNHLYDDVELDSLQRRDARFINSCLMATLTGAVVSDGLENQRVLSGVGGQFDFVAMAHALPDGRSIIALRSTRESGGRTTSNIRLSYGHVTIPRHLRDIVITEYGIADLRGKSDFETCAAMLNIADSRFQNKLLRQAKRAGKLPADYRIPAEFRDNLPRRVNRAADAAPGDCLSPFPLGSDLTAVEKRLAGALKRLDKRNRSLAGRFQALAAAALAKPGQFAEPLQRLDLAAPGTLRERFYARLVAGELARGG